VCEVGCLGRTAKHASQAQEKARCARETAKKEAQKAEEGAVYKAQIQEEIKTKVFTGVSSPLHLFFLTYLSPW